MPFQLLLGYMLLFGSLPVQGEDNVELVQVGMTQQTSLLEMVTQERDALRKENDALRDAETSLLEMVTQLTQENLQLRKSNEKGRSQVGSAHRQHLRSLHKEAGKEEVHAVIPDTILSYLETHCENWLEDCTVSVPTGSTVDCTDSTVAHGTSCTWSTEPGYVCNSAASGRSVTRTCGDGSFASVDGTTNYSCSDVDECFDGSDNCATSADGSSVATCTNTDGSFSCACNAGYSDSTDPPLGLTCTDIDDCADGPCDANALCTDGVDSHTCACNSGYEGDGFTCTATTTTTTTAQAAFVLGSPNTNVVCPSGYSSIQDETTCQTAAGALGLAWASTGSFRKDTKWCIKAHGGKVYFNQHPIGISVTTTFPVCEETTSSASSSLAKMETKDEGARSVLVKELIDSAKIRMHMGGNAASATTSLQ